MKFLFQLNLHSTQSSHEINAISTPKKDIIKLATLDDISVGQQVDVIIKATTIAPSEPVVSNAGKQLTKQECIISDSTGSARLVLWEKDIGKLDIQSCYKINALGYECIKMPSIYLFPTVQRLVQLLTLVKLLVMIIHLPLCNS